MSRGWVGQVIGLVALLLFQPVASAQDDAWSKHTEQGRAARERGDYVEAERLLRLAVNEVQQLGADDARTAYVLDELASLLTALSKFAEAEVVATRALGINEAGSGPNSLEVRVNLNTLADVYDAQGRYEQAEALYRRALTIVEMAPNADAEDLGGALQNLGSILIHVRKDQEAERLHFAPSSCGRRHSVQMIPLLRGRSTISRSSTAATTGLTTPNVIIGDHVRSSRRPWGRTIRSSPRACTTWDCSTETWDVMAMPSAT